MCFICIYIHAYVCLPVSVSIIYSLIIEVMKHFVQFALAVLLLIACRREGQSCLVSWSQCYCVHRGAPVRERGGDD